MRAGQLRQRVRLQQVTETQSASGAPVPTWTDIAERWATIEPQTGREFFAAKQTFADMTHLVRLRHLPGVGPKMRLQLGSRTLRILGVVNVLERSRELLVACDERVIG